MTSRYDMSWLDEYEGLSGGAQLQLELMSPFNAYDMIRDPNLENLLKAFYMPTMAYFGYWGASALVGEAAPSFWVRQAIRYENLKHGLRSVASAVPHAVVIGTPVAASVAGAVAYEKAVNEPIRRSHYSTSGTWFGPFASGFGTVVG